MLTPEELNTLLLKETESILQQWPDDNYYKGRYRAGLMLATPELAIFDYIMDCKLPGPILELGAGFGQLSLLLSCCGGYTTIALDVADRRISGCEQLKKASPRGDRCTPLLGRYPQGRTKLPQYELIESTNTISGCWTELGLTEEARWTALLRDEQKDLVLDLERAGCYRPHGSPELLEAHSILEQLGWTVKSIPAVAMIGDYDICHLMRS